MLILCNLTFIILFICHHAHFSGLTLFWTFSSSSWKVGVLNVCLVSVCIVIIDIIFMNLHLWRLIGRKTRRRDCILTVLVLHELAVDLIYFVFARFPKARNHCFDLLLMILKLSVDSQRAMHRAIQAFGHIFTLWVLRVIEILFLARHLWC